MMAMAMVDSNDFSWPIGRRVAPIGWLRVAQLDNTLERLDIATAGDRPYMFSLRKWSRQQIWWNVPGAHSIVVDSPLKYQLIIPSHFNPNQWKLTSEFQLRLGRLCSGFGRTFVFPVSLAVAMARSEQCEARLLNSFSQSVNPMKNGSIHHSY